MGKTYLVKQGDTLGDIARRNNTTVDAIAKLNGITDPNKIDSGQILKLPESNSAAAGDTSTQPKGGANADARASGITDCQSPAGVCPCNGDISLVPVRYAIDERPANKGGAQPHPLPKGPDFRWPLALKGSAYTLRQLRDGWLYVYNETSKELDEYEIKGAQFIHASKGAKGHVIYPRSAMLSLCYSPHVWSERIKSIMSDVDKGKSVRSQWMRTLSLPVFVRNLGHTHGAPIDQLNNVADMNDGNQAFVLSCTPLLKDVDEDQQGDVRLLSHKAAYSQSIYMTNMPDPKSAMMIALADPLADVADLSMVVNSLMAQQDALLGSNDEERKQTSHKLMMAEVTRNLARVRVGEQDLPASVRGDAAKAYEFETVLDEYLGYRNLEQMEEMSGEALGAMRGIRSPLAERVDDLQKTLANEYGFTPSLAQEKAWSERSRFQNEVNWKGLNDFVARYQAPLAELAHELALAHQDLSVAISHLKADPLPLGLDPEQVKGQAYLSLLFAEAGQALSLSCQDERAAEAMKKLASTPSNLLALGPYGFDVRLFDGLTAQTVDQPWLTGSSGDMTAFWGRLADLESLLGDEHIKQKGWYQASAAVFDAMREASRELAKGARETLLAVVLPHGNINNLGTLLRLVLLESVLGEMPLQLAEHGAYRTKQKAFEQSVAKEQQNSHTDRSGGYQSKHHQDAQSVIKQQKMLALMQEASPLIQLKADAYTEAGRQYVRGYLTRVSEALGSGKRELFTALNSNNTVPNMGTVGGLVALINLWNLLVVTQATGENINSLGEARASAQWGAAVGWTGNAVMALYQGQASTALLGKETLKGNLITSVSISKAIAEGSGVLVKTFTNRMLAFAGLGLVAAVAEAWDTFEAAKDPLLGEVERLLMRAKIWVLGGQGVVFFIQVATLGSSSFGLGAISAIFATWMLTSLFVLGVAYLLLTVLINIFKRSELEKWLAQSTWGTQPNTHWTAEQELKELEHIVHKPAARIVTKETSSHFGWGGTSYDRYLEIDLPGYLQGQWFDLHLSGQPQLGIGQGAGIRSVEEVKRLAASMTPYTPVLSDGRWQGSQFSLWLGPQNSEYRLTVSYGGLYGGQLIFSGKASRGEMTLSASSAGALAMTRLPVGTAKG
ncbi:T6SS effector BTH_I2691 family protein [Aeromonas sp. 5HA1]|uniref:T6SS effector BTH_I2691 family protein n=1 Tax=Aeromonas sp. 5HA1 TaxID=2699197 RepID=UPI0023DDAFBB|nr:T6SS effector BTH_I2691 family protein [Aeromonas sp. 5HA1]MDF2400078.1 LysM peptidoglycan-binding domain-containing protein [Aeromonas sp. 5HA1]